jgi:hypothetical protein
MLTMPRTSGKVPNMTNLDAYQTFVQLLYEACHTSEAVDNFDLRSNPVSMEKWKVLLDEQKAGFLALTHHVQSHASAIIAQIEEPET